MIVQVNTDSNIEGSSELSQRIETEVRSGLDRFVDKLTRVEVHLRDQNSDKKSGSADMDCFLEARLEGLQPLVVSHQAATLDQAVDGAIEKLERVLDSTLGRLSNR